MNPDVMTLIGGSALLIFSIEEVSKSVQYLAGSRFRVWINNFSENRLSGIILGIALSLLLSSSGAVTVMLVGLANARLLSVERIFSVILGASIGTTFIVHLFALNISHYGLLIIAVGVFLTSVAKSDRILRMARGLLSFGLMFYAMSLVASAGAAMESNELFRFIIQYFKENPFIVLAISCGLTALIQSSSSTIAFVMSLMMARHATLEEAMPWILGANLGTTATAYLASLKGGVLGKQVAFANLFCKLIGVILCYPLMKYFIALVQQIGGDVAHQIANAHTLFNVLLAVVFFPFIPLGVAAVRKIVAESEDKGPFTYQYLDSRTLETPELALAQAQREILRLSDTVEQMVEKSIHLFRGGSQKDIESLKASDQVVDFLNRGIKLYLTKLSQKEMTPEQVQKEFELLLRTNDLENIGDIVDKNILELVRKNIKKGYVFSQEGWGEILQFHSKVVECLRISTAYFSSHDLSLAAKLMVLHQQIEDMTLDLSEQHVQRLHKGIKESLDTTSVHLDLLGNLQRIAALSVNFTRIHGLKGVHAPQMPEIIK